MTKPNLRVIKGESRKPRTKQKLTPKVHVVRVLQPGGTQKTSVRVGLPDPEEE